MHGFVAGMAILLVFGGCAAPTSTPREPPRLVLDEQHFDAGDVEQGDVVRHRFVVRNGGGSPLRLGEPRASCDCIATVADANVIAPRASGAIEVALDTTLLAGAVSRTITLFANDPSEPTTRLTIAASVRPTVVIEPRELYLGEVQRGQRIERSVRLSFPRDPSGRVVEVTPRGKVVEPRASASGFSVAIAPEAPSGVFRESIAVHTTAKQAPVVSVVVAGILVDSDSQGGNP